MQGKFLFSQLPELVINQICLSCMDLIFQVLLFKYVRSHILIHPKNFKEINVINLKFERASPNHIQALNATPIANICGAFPPRVRVCVLFPSAGTLHE